MRWGLSISLSGELADPRAVADVAAAAEEAGWDGVFVWDHLWNRTLAPFADPFVTLAAIATATERVVIGTMVTALPRRRTQLVAQSTTSLDRLSGGRMVLGLGLGVDSYGEYSVFGEPADDDRARAAALDTAIPLLDQMLTGGAVPLLGGRVTTPPGVQQPRVPIWIAARAGRPAGPRRVRRHGVEGLALVGVDNVPGSRPIESEALPERCVLLFGQEGPGLSPAAPASASVVVSITQYGSTRSLNAGVASGIALHAWAGTHAR